MPEKLKKTERGLVAHLWGERMKHRGGNRGGKLPVARNRNTQPIGILCHFIYKGRGRRAQEKNIKKKRRHQHKSQSKPDSVETAKWTKKKKKKLRGLSAAYTWNRVKGSLMKKPFNISCEKKERRET